MSPKAVEYGVLDVVDVVENVLHLAGEVRGDEFNMVCPNPKHLDSRPSCSVNVDTGYWSCFSCGVGGDIAKLTETVLGVGFFEAQGVLRPSTDEGLLSVIKKRLEAVGTRFQEVPHRERHRLPGPYDPGPLDYMYERGFSDATCHRWGLRFVKKETLQGKRDKFTIRNSIAIPVRDARGHLRAWCYRATGDSPRWQPKYIYTPGVEISDLWYGHQHHGDAREVTVVEGALDAMWTDQAGIAAWGLLGSKMGVQKILRLTDCHRVVLLPDLDDAGHEWVVRVAEQIGTRVPLFIGQYREWMLSKRPSPETGEYAPATDPEELRPLDLEIVHASAVPYFRWRERYRS